MKTRGGRSTNWYGCTYRFRGHSMRDPAGSVYRTKEEVEREKLRDPITLFSDRCLKEGLGNRKARKAAEVLPETSVGPDATL